MSRPVRLAVALVAAAGAVFAALEFLALVNSRNFQIVGLRDDGGSLGMSLLAMAVLCVGLGGITAYLLRRPN